MRSRVYACVLLVAAICATAVPARSQSADIEAASDELSRVTEEFNEAKLHRQELDGELAEARDALDRSEARLAGTREELGQAVREMYMHPTAGIDAFFSARSFGDLSRGSALSQRVVLDAEGILLQIRRAKAEEQTAAGRLEGLRDQARERELALAERQDEAEAAFEQVQAQIARANQTARAAAHASELANASSIAADITDAGPARGSAATAVRTAAAQIGKPYRWGGSGPNNFDCSGLTAYAWAAAGVSLPHSSRAQYSSLPKVSRSDLQPGDLVFFGSPIHHVGIYEGGGVMINSPRTGENVRRNSIGRRDYAGAARP